MSNEHTLIELFLQAGPVVKLVMLILLAASILSWTLIIQRGKVLKQALQAQKQFENVFWSGGNLTQLYQQQQHQSSQGLGAIFNAGFGEFLRLRKQRGQSSQHLLEGTQRKMRATQGKEMDKLERGLAILASIGSTAPYIGLFGTVWGIMNAFSALGQVEQATISMVAPGISEALIATAMGLFAAIPAVLAYNRYTDQVDRLYNQYEAFQDELTTILHRQLQAATQSTSQAPETTESANLEQGVA